MHYYLVSPTALSQSDNKLLTYHSEVELKPGSIIRISLGQRTVSGVVFAATGKPQFPTKPIGELLEPKPLPKAHLALAEWMSSYYATPLPLVLQTMLPRGLGKVRRREYSLSHPKRKRTNIVLNIEQIAALAAIQKARSGTVLLRGVTGSGKTYIYIEQAKKVLARGRSVIILVPEIALTSQLTAEFANHFDNLLVTHSTMSEAQRHFVWRKCLEADKPMVVIGPRSALFAPLADIGLVAIDECHEPAYKQEQAPRYSALRAASILMHESGGTLILGSATPSITDTYMADAGHHPILRMNKAAVEAALKPQVTVVDITKRRFFGRHRIFSSLLLEAIEASLQQSKQALIFHNRRGSAPTTICESCGFLAACPRCLLPLTLHADMHRLKCHVCGYEQPVPPFCPECGRPDIIHKGIGTKRITEELQKQFPNARIARYDADAKVSEQLHAQYQELYDGKIDIIVGTQMIAKGLDLPRLNTVGIVQADGGLSLPDYQSQERVFQLIYQVSGRVGRNTLPSTVVVQTYQPQHPSVIHGVAQDYDSFYEYAVAERRRAVFPPFTHLLKLTCSYKTETGAINAAKNLAEELRSRFKGKVSVFGPVPSFYERVADTYRWQLLVKSPQREQLLQMIQYVPKQKWYIDIDPGSIL